MWVIEGENELRLTCSRMESGIALLRCAMIAFVEVSSFGIGTSTMYLATVHPLLVLYAFAGLLLYGIPRKTDKRRENA